MRKQDVKSVLYLSISLIYNNVVHNGIQH